MFQNKKADIEYLRENVSIQSYAEYKLGITEWKQTSRGYVKPNLKYAPPDANDYSSLSINLEENFFTRFSGKGITPKGDIINFIRNVNNCDFPTAVNELIEYANAYLGDMPDREAFAKQIKEFRKKQVDTANINTEFHLPLKYKNNKRVICYMIEHRKINKNIVFYMLKNNYLYQSFDAKCCFVSYEDGIPTFACIRDTNWNERITYGVKNSKVKQGWYFNTDSNSLVVTEAVVDAMAYMSILDLKGENWMKHNYLALTGCSKLMCIEYQLERNKNINEVFLAFDNDEAGEKARLEAKKLLKKINFKGECYDVIVKHGKDVNDELKYIKSIAGSA